MKKSRLSYRCFLGYRLTVQGDPVDFFVNILDFQLNQSPHFLHGFAVRFSWENL